MDCFGSGASRTFRSLTASGSVVRMRGRGRITQVRNNINRSLYVTHIIILGMETYINSLYSSI